MEILILLAVLAATVCTVVIPLALFIQNSKLSKEIAEIKNRLSLLEKNASFHDTPETQETREIQTLPESPSSSVSDRETADEIGNTPEKIRIFINLINTPIKNLIRGVNLWAAGGIILLTAAFAMLITFLARRGFFTVEMGIASAAMCGIIMIITGWRFRRSRYNFFLLLQGGGIGILYLSVFASNRFTPYFPPLLSIILMSLLMTPAIALALIQNSLALALLGFLGGFAAPILISEIPESAGTHIFLFSYYIVLSMGVLAIGFYRSWKKMKAWKALNTAAFLSVFTVLLLWTLTHYNETFLGSAQFFSISFLVIFTATGIQGLKTDTLGYSDIILLAGTPLLSAVMQWHILSPIPHGRAAAAVLFSLLYLGLAVLLRRSRHIFGENMRSVLEGYSGLAVFLVNAAMYLELPPHITSAIWAVESAVIMFLGLRLRNAKIMISAFIQHTAAVIVFLSVNTHQFPVALVIAFSALSMALLLNRYSAQCAKLKPEKIAPILTVWAFLWWFGAWIFELNRIADPRFTSSLFEFRDPWQSFLFLSSVSALISYIASRRLRYIWLNVGAVPSMLCAIVLIVKNITQTYSAQVFAYNFFQGAYLWAWLVFFTVKIYIVLFSIKEISAHQKLEKLHAIWSSALIMIVLILLTSSIRAVTLYHNFAESWIRSTEILPCLLLIAALSFLEKRISHIPPFHQELLFFKLPAFISCVLGLWFLATLFISGNPAPLPYIPVLNPLEIQQALCIAALFLWLTQKKIKNIKKIKFTAASGAVFLWVTAIIARSVHVYADVPMSYIPQSSAFHLGIFIFWALYGIAHIITGSRIKSRPVWIAGAILTIIDVAKLLFLDLADTGTLTRILSFFIAGLALLFIGWASPLPPERIAEKSEKEELS